MLTTIKITGLAYCHPATLADGSRELRVLFLHPDNRHRLRVEIKKNQTQSPEPVKTSLNISNGTQMRLTATGATPTGETANPVENIDRLHGILPGTPGLSLKRLNDPDTFKLSYLSIPGATQLHTAEMTLRPYEIWRLDGVTPARPNGTSKTFIAARLLKTHLGVSFEVRDNGNLNLLLSRTVNSELNFPHPDGTSYEILFDNTCPDDVCFDDFHYYYDILDGRGVKFEEIPPPFMPGPIVQSDKDTACNVVIGDPQGCTLEEYFLRGGSCPQE